jgi:hypothetical protein
VKAILLNGGKLDNQEMTKIRSIVTKEFNDCGWEIENIDLENLSISKCLGCFGCWVKTPGICVINDEGRTIAEKVIQSDIVIFFTPVVFGGYSSELKKAIDRLIPLISPIFTKINNETHHKPRYAKYPSLLGVGILSQENGEKAKLFRVLVERNAINFHSPSYTSDVLVIRQSDEIINNKVHELLMKVGVING